MEADFNIRLALGQPNLMEVWKEDVVLKRPLLFKAKGGKGTGNRKPIKELSSKALKALAFTASNTSRNFQTMITLTYPQDAPTDGKQVKRHLNTFMTALRRKRGNLGYLWFLEFQQRGAPHFHILLTTPFINWSWVAERWYKIVGSGEKCHLNAGTKIERLRSEKHARHYVVKYAMKPYQKIVPVEYKDVGRFWGCSWCVQPKLMKTIQVLGYEDVLHYLRDWAYKYIINHDSLVTVLYNASGFL